MREVKVNIITALSFLFFWTFNSFGQEIEDSLLFNEGVCDKDGYCIPRIEGMGKPKGLELKYRNIFQYEINSKIEDLDTSYAGEMKRERKIEFKAKVPIVLKNNFKLLLGLKYSSEQFKFKDQDNLSNSFFSALNRKPLQSFGTTLYATKPFIGKNYLFMRANFRVSGDFSQNSLEDYFRSSISLVHGWRKNTSFSWGVGVSYNYTFGRQSIIPVVALSKKISPNWNFDALLPIRMKLRYSGNEKNIFEIETKVAGENYNITLEPNTNNNLFIQRSDWLSMATYEREVYDFIWIGASVGNRYNISFDLFEKNAFIDRSAPVISNNLRNTFFAEASLILVPTKKMLEKFNKKGL